ncbi:lipoprotein blc, putative [Ichthyophthirius multifiliis]|uniref:Lipoprotein blc, putative n=1 Tax=Ichthyophthirius multifiliis TaxID=5932 RepID=G0QXP5_ICHMU|nr:lipoprotein blc, putative [Ichthyophthirius multifiliis]EGR29982.1 lipoprotein blc, putative [Ichthyophthirius multifiliis]|eukprot:XP_004031218.1 lipoprotein blc, putative [Ichthyophthirius multifiliis]
MIKFLILSLLCVSALAVSGNKGACRAQNYTNVDVDFSNRYLGRWYNIYVSASMPFQYRDDLCNLDEYSIDKYGNMRALYKGMHANQKVTEFLQQVKKVGPGHLKIKFFSLQPIGANYEVPYINDDYTVSVVVGCNAFGFLGQSDIWIITRSYNPDPLEVQKALDFIKQAGFDDSDLVPVSTKGCAKIK